MVQPCCNVSPLKLQTGWHLWSTKSLFISAAKECSFLVVKCGHCLGGRGEVLSSVKRVESVDIFSIQFPSVMWGWWEISQSVCVHTEPLCPWLLTGKQGSSCDAAQSVLCWVSGSSLSASLLVWGSHSLFWWGDLQLWLFFVCFFFCGLALERFQILSHSYNKLQCVL